MFTTTALAAMVVGVSPVAKPTSHEGVAHPHRAPSAAPVAVDAMVIVPVAAATALPPSLTAIALDRGRGVDGRVNRRHLPVQLGAGMPKSAIASASAGQRAPAWPARRPRCRPTAEPVDSIPPTSSAA
jgi:hypothetical protein